MFEILTMFNSDLSCQGLNYVVKQNQKKKILNDFCPKRALC